MIESPSHDLLPLLAKDKNIKLFNGNPTGNQYTFRFNSTAKPFDNPKIRMPSWCFNQEDFLKATIGDPAYFKPCKAPFVCRHAAGQRCRHGRRAERQRRQGQADPDRGGLRRHADRADAVDRPAGPDQPRAGRQGADGARRLQVDMVAMDWQTLVAAAPRRIRRTPRWHAFLTRGGADILNR